MSIKIYEGYRFKTNKLNECMDIVGAEVADQFADWVFQFLPEGDRTYPLFELFHVMDRASKAPERSMYDPDTSWDFWINDDGYVYAIPYGRFRPDMEKLPWVEDYCYWNNVDLPEGIDEDTFYARGDTWERVCLNTWNDRRLEWKITEGSQNSIGMTRLWERLDAKTGASQQGSRE